MNLVKSTRGLTLLVVSLLISAAAVIPANTAFAAVIVVPTDHPTIQAAVDAASDGDTVELLENIDTSAQITITKPLTLDGNGFTLNPLFAKTSNSNNAAIGIHSTHDVTIQDLTVNGSGGTSLHGINTYLSTDITLSNVTIMSANNAALIVNGSTVEATNFTTTGSGWGAVNIDPGSGVTAPSAFTLVSGTLNENTQVWSDGKYVTGPATVTVVMPSGYQEYATYHPTQPSKTWTNKPLQNVASITKLGVTTIYPTITLAIANAVAGDVINVALGTFTENVLINKNDITLQGAGSANTTIAPASGTPLSTAGNVMNIADITISGFTLDSSTAVAFIALSGTPNDSAWSSNITLHDIVADGSLLGLFSVNSATLTNVAVKNVTGAAGALEVAGVANLTITDSVFENNEIGVRVLPTGDGDAADGYGPNGPITISNSSFEGNTNFAIKNEDSLFVVNAQGNWFGDASGPTHASNPSGMGDKVSDFVDFDLSCGNSGCMTNLAPTANNMTILVPVNGWASFTLDFTDEDDFSGETFSFTVGTPEDGELTGDAPDLTYTPDEDFFGTDSFEYSVNDGENESNTATVTLISYYNPECPEGMNFIGGNVDKCMNIGVFVGIAGLPSNIADLIEILLEEYTSLEDILSFLGTLDEFVQVDVDFIDPTCPAGIFFALHDVCENDGSEPLVCEEGFHEEDGECVADEVEETETPTEENNSGGSSNSGGGGGGGGYIPPVPQVLGAATSSVPCFQFTKSLVFGMNGNDVLELQKILAAKGFLTATPNGNFGPATLAAVKAFQAANGLEQVGQVGPQTRALLNKSCTPGTNPNQALIDELTKKLQALLVQIQALLAARGQ